MSYRVWSQRVPGFTAIDGAEVWNVPLALANLIVRPGGKTSEERTWVELDRIVHEEHRAVTAVGGTDDHHGHALATTWVLAADASVSIVGTNVASDALSNLSSPGVVGGALIIVGEDYGEGASVIQERTHAVALKSSMLLLDPRPDLEVMVRMVEHGFRLSEASSMPAVLELRIRACHVRGSFACKDNIAPASRRAARSASRPRSTTRSSPIRR